jgi:lantibiotic modifying enzyme
MAPGIDTDERLDILDGAAGAALALLALAEAAPQTDALRLAIACGDRVIASGVAGVDGVDGLAWPAPDGPPLVGFAHGAAGVSTALARLFRATGAERFRRAAALGCRFVEHQFLTGAGNYAIAGTAAGATPGMRPAMLAWCHGAPGILIGLGPQLDFCPETAILSQFDSALGAIAGDYPAQVDHLCCGAHGRVEALLTAGRALGRSGLIDDAWRLATAVATRASDRGHFRLSGAGMEYRVFDPGFFRGLSGIGYQWLRLASPALPSVAGLEPAPPRTPRPDVHGSAPAGTLSDRNL